MTGHASHGWWERSTDHIHNVSYLHTHALMECSCGFLGWIAR